MSISFSGGTLTVADGIFALYLAKTTEKKQSQQVITDFEQRFARQLGSSHAFSFGAGRIALYAILKAMDIGKDDEVILPAFTCVVVPNAIRYLGAKPVYVDISEKTLNLDPDKIEAAITPKTKAILAAHNFGLVMQMPPLQQIASRHGLYLIEDCAHSLGSTHHGQWTGTFSDAAFFSLEQTKPITADRGGIAVTDNPALAQKIRDFQDSLPFPSPEQERNMAMRAFVSACFRHPRAISLDRHLTPYLHRFDIYNASTTTEEIAGEKPKNHLIRLGTVQAALAIRQLRRLPEIITCRQQHGAFYLQMLKQLDTSRITLPEIAPGTSPAWLRFPLLVPKIFKSASHELVYGDWFQHPIHPKGSNLSALGFKESHYPNAMSVCSRIINLPTHPRISASYRERYINDLKSMLLKGE